MVVVKAGGTRRNTEEHGGTRKYQRYQRKRRLKYDVNSVDLTGSIHKTTQDVTITLQLLLMRALTVNYSMRVHPKRQVRETPITPVRWHPRWHLTIEEEWEVQVTH